jgi:hypothetical protein
MQRIKIMVEVAYRDDGQISRGAVLDAVRGLFLSVDRAALFKTHATWAGYRVDFPPASQIAK